jgi:hypothetical protein
MPDAAKPLFLKALKVLKNWHGLCFINYASAFAGIINKGALCKKA